jgi:phage terminase large subunit GpA-like protein
MNQVVLQHPTAADCLATFWLAAQPRRSLPVSEWADTHRELSGKQAGERGRYRTSRTPFLREIMDCFSYNSRVTDIVVMKSSQVGVTEATVNVIGYVMDHAPCPMMVMLPTLDNRDKWKTQKLNPLLTDTPIVRDLLGGNRSRDAANRQDMIDFPGGVLFLAGGNSPNSYAQTSVRIIILDDFDRFPAGAQRRAHRQELRSQRPAALPRPVPAL